MTGRVLIVDDSPSLREVFTEVLTEAGHLVWSAGSAREGLELLSNLSLDVVVSAVVMPDMDGLQLLRAVRQRDLDIPVVLITGSPSLDTALAAMEQGALRYLMKPVAESDLVSVVDDAVRLRRIAILKREALAHLGSGRGLVGDRAGLEVSFANAIGTLHVVYQPIVRAEDGSTFGFEALTRTLEPTLQSPAAFFDAAERLNRVHEVSRVIRSQVARSMNGPEPVVFVNLHPSDLSDDWLATGPLAKRAHSVVLEVTERAVLPEPTLLRGRIAVLRDLGFRIAVDDLGAGYAGLSSFAALEPEIVKLDMSLIRGVDVSPIKRRLVGSMAALCHDLKALVIAEGIETEAERVTCRTLGCDLLQGFLIGRPLPLLANTHLGGGKP